MWKKHCECGRKMRRDGQCSSCSRKIKPESIVDPNCWAAQFEETGPIRPRKLYSCLGVFLAAEEIAGLVNISVDAVHQRIYKGTPLLRMRMRK